MIIRLNIELSDNLFYYHKRLLCNTFTFLGGCCFGKFWNFSSCKIILLLPKSNDTCLTRGMNICNYKGSKFLNLFQSYQKGKLKLYILLLQVEAAPEYDEDQGAATLSLRSQMKPIPEVRSYVKSVGKLVKRHPDSAVY